jgi:putative NADH-flavin reductase
MRVLIFGATGPSGILLTRELLQLSDTTVVVYVRNPQKLPEDLSANDAVRVVKGTLNSYDDIERTMEGVDAVISLLGPTGTSHGKDKPLNRGYQNIIRAMKARGTKRILALGTASMKDSKDKFQLSLAAVVASVKTVAKNVYVDVVAVGETVRAIGDDLDWTLYRVPLLNNKKSQAYSGGFVGDGSVKAFLSRSGLVAFVLEELQHPKWIHQAPMIYTP